MMELDFTDRLDNISCPVMMVCGEKDNANKKAAKELSTLLKNASIYFYHKGLIKYTGVMLAGKMEVLADQETKDMIWRKGDTLFYKEGVIDPDYCVLKFTAQSGRYYCDFKTESFEV